MRANGRSGSHAAEFRPPRPREHAFYDFSGAMFSLRVLSQSSYNHNRRVTRTLRRIPGVDSFSGPGLTGKLPRSRNGLLFLIWTAHPLTTREFRLVCLQQLSRVKQPASHLHPTRVRSNRSTHGKRSTGGSPPWPLRGNYFRQEIP